MASNLSSIRSDADDPTHQKKNPVVSVAITVVVGALLAIATLTGIISALVAIVIFVVVVVAMVVFHGGGADMVSGLSDVEGYERDLEEEEQRKAQEAEEAGEGPTDGE